MNILKHGFIAGLLILLILHLSSPAVASTPKYTTAKAKVIRHHVMINGMKTY